MATPQGSPLQNCTFSLRDTGPHLIHVSLGPPKRHLDRSSVFAGLTLHAPYNLRGKFPPPSKLHLFIGDTGPRLMRGFSDPLETTPQTMATVSRPESRCEFGCPPNCPFSRGNTGPHQYVVFGAHPKPHPRRRRRRRARHR